MTYYFPLENLTQSTNITGVALYANEITGGLFWLLGLMAVWAIMFIAMIRFGEKEALTSSSFFAAIISYLMAAMGLIQPGYVVIPTGLTILGVLILGNKRGA